MHSKRYHYLIHCPVLQYYYTSERGEGRGVPDACSYKHEPFEQQSFYVHLKHSAKGYWLAVDN
jgi:hypothetical protein